VRVAVTAHKGWQRGRGHITYARPVTR